MILAMTTPTMIAGYLALFVAFGFAFLFVNLLVGKFLRPKAPNAEKLEIYECGEPTIGSSFVQFDIRFYVVALLFIIFDVEIAFFFPWANVFGKATHLRDPNFKVVQTTLQSDGSYSGATKIEQGSLKIDTANQLTPAAAGVFRELGVPAANAPTTTEAIRETGDKLAQWALIDILVFFAVLMVGFAYVWRRGDLDWVRATTAEREIPQRQPPTISVEREPVLST
jgi:NADH-quinone oxidoreductase subunit A